MAALNRGMIYCQDPVELHDHSSDASCTMWWLSISVIDSPVSSIRKKYRNASMFIMTRASSTPRDVKRRESGSMFCETIEPFPEVRMNRVESMKTQCWKVSWLKDEIYSFRSKTNSILPVSLFAVHDLILRCLTGSHMTTLSKQITACQHSHRWLSLI